jgi:signal peptidase I
MLRRLVGRWFLVVQVSGPSMLPTLRDGDRVLVRRVPGSAVRTGQIVVLAGPGSLGLLIKRVAAVPGEPTPRYVPGAPAVVPDGTLVLLSDNRLGGVDSRTVGLFPTAGLAGVVRRFL